MNPNIGKLAAIGGIARRNALTKKRRREIAVKAAIIRWLNERARKGLTRHA